MRYQPDHKERTRKQILDTAARLFRRNGVVATGVVPLMKDVGLTQGGFYAHFASKEELVREASVAAVQQTLQGLQAAGERAGGGDAGLKAVVGAYLSDAHLERVDSGCAIASVGSELAREPDATREAAMVGTRQLIALIESYLPEDASDRWSVAAGVFGLLSGALQLARLTVDIEEAKRILQSGRASALKLAGIAAAS